MTRRPANLLPQLYARMSLREPQRQSLSLLAEVLDRLPQGADVVQALAAVQAVYPQVEDFEREFPSLCFALATGVGKTRLMGAFIAYLYLTGRSRHFFVLAPNLTIYEKLIRDFNPAYEKYVLRGIAEFAQAPPVLVTGENYEQGVGIRLETARGLTGDFFAGEDAAHINIFNISKINTETRGGASPRIKRLAECIGESYFEYLAGLPDLVVLMDEAHRYRASAGMRAINELKPILGLELTATPRTVGAKSQRFRNVIYDYPLARALADGFVKEPAVATRQNFRIQDHTPEDLERIKLEDGIHHHEYVKVELETYAQIHGVPRVKPFMLVVAQDTAHAGLIRQRIESSEFFEGRYAGKVIEVHSALRGEESDEATARLLAVEHDEATEIVIHVNKLKEGWDVTNLYTIVPLRASASDILTEQTIGRGLRLPYGRRTGQTSIDRLTIIAHDRFQAVLDAANHADSIIRQGLTIGAGGDVPDAPPQKVDAPSLAETLATGRPASLDGLPLTSPPVLSPQEATITETTLEVLRHLERRVEVAGKLADLERPEVQARIRAEVVALLSPRQAELGLAETEEDVVTPVVARVTRAVVEHTIDMPQIVIRPEGEVGYGFNDFDLQHLERLHYPPVEEAILIQHLRDHARDFVTWSGEFKRETRPENYLVRALIERDEIDYDGQANLLYKLAGQVVSRLRQYLTDETQVENVLAYYQKPLADFIWAQMQHQVWLPPLTYKAFISRGFTLLRPNTYTLPAGAAPQPFRAPITSRSAVRQMVFTDFAKCCYPLQKFDSVDGEWRLAQVLEDDSEVLRWMKPATGHFRIEYRNGKPYEPDFVVETREAKWLVEPKRRDELEDEDVRDKARAAARWCRFATGVERERGGKPWQYSLIPHDEIHLGMTFKHLAQIFQVNDEPELPD